MKSVELVYDGGCPNAALARANLLRAFAASGVSARWTEWERSCPRAPAGRGNLGSPTILVDGRDVGGTHAIDGSAACRIYRGADGRTSGAPSVESIARALTGRETSRRWRLAAVPGVLAAALPGAGCPMCWPAYAGLLSALGLGVLVSSVYLLPLTAALAGVAVITMFFRARQRRRYEPMALGAAAAALLVVGKFVLVSGLIGNAGAAGLVLASAWSVWPYGLRREAGR